MIEIILDGLKKAAISLIVGYFTVIIGIILVKVFALL
jgi:hypothetical protein